MLKHLTPALVLILFKVNLALAQPSPEPTLTMIQDGSFPLYDLEAACAFNLNSIGDISDSVREQFEAGCLEDETKARSELENGWEDYEESLRMRAKRLAVAEQPGSYVNLQSYLESLTDFDLPNPFLSE